VAELERLPPDTELVSASFPCVDVSRAGGRAGIDGAATGLVRHVFRLLGDPTGPRVPWVLLENVVGLLDRSADGPPAVAYVCSELERLGYSWAQRVVSSAAFGVPQRRRRVFIVASLHGDPRDVLLAQNYNCLGACAAAFGQPCAECGLAGAPVDADVTPPDTGSRDAPSAADAAATALQMQLGVAVDLSNAQNAPCVGMLPTMTTGNCRMAILLPGGAFGLVRIQDAERLQGLPVDWTEPAAVLGSRGGSASREGAERRFDVALRWGLVGNAVCVPIGRWLGDRLRAPYAAKYVPREAAVPFTSGTADAWPRAAWCVKGVPGGRFRAEAGEAPLYAPFPPIGHFVRVVGPPPSAEAVAVWAGRMRSAGWTVAGPLRRALDAVLAAAPRGLYGDGAGGVTYGDAFGAAAALPAPPRAAPDSEALARSVFLREPRERRMVWAKYAAFPWWPGLQAELGKDHVPERTLKAAGRADDSVLVVFFGDGTWQWCKPDAVVDFAPGFAQHAAQNVGRAKALFAAAVAEAREMHEAQQRPTQAGPPAPVATLPATALAPAEMAARRCGQCRSCRSGAAHRACLMADARRLAAAGHGGAALTAAGHAARGRRVEIFWVRLLVAQLMMRCAHLRFCRDPLFQPLDERYYLGTLREFDPFSCHHRVLYDDDEWETVALWKETVAAVDVAPPPPGSRSAREGDVESGAQVADAAAAAAEAEEAEEERAGGWDSARRTATQPLRVAPPPASPPQASALTTALVVVTPGAHDALAPAPSPDTAADDGSRRRGGSKRALADAPAAAPAAEEPKRRRAAAKEVDYAAMCSIPRERAMSLRCAACKTQKKGTCGTPTASRLCLMRTPDMPLRRDPARRFGAASGFRFRPASTLPVLPPGGGGGAAFEDGQGELLGWPAAEGPAPPASALRLLPPPGRGGRAGRGAPAPPPPLFETIEEPTRVPWHLVHGYNG